MIFLLQCSSRHVLMVLVVTDVFLLNVFWLQMFRSVYICIHCSATSSLTFAETMHILKTLDLIILYIITFRIFDIDFLFCVQFSGTLYDLLLEDFCYYGYLKLLANIRNTDFFLRIFILI